MCCGDAYVQYVYIVYTKYQIAPSKAVVGVHYANMSVQYTAIFHGCKNDKYQMKILIFFLFLLKTEIVGTR